MKITEVGKQPNFGIKYVGKNLDKKIIDSIKDSNLIKEIDQKYPNASFNYFKLKQEDLSNDEEIWTTLLDLMLNPKKVWHFRLDSHSNSSADKYLIKEINSMSLADLESEISKQAKEGTTHKIIEVNIIAKKSNPLIDFFNKLFGKKN